MRKGTRTKKLETVQLWKCLACGRVFTPSPAALRHKTYPLNVILDGITFYNLGHTLAEAAAKLKSRHGHAIAPSTLAGWIDEHRELATYARLRDAGRRLAPPHKPSAPRSSITARFTNTPIIARSWRC